MKSRTSQSMLIKIFAAIHDHPKVTSVLGAVSGWASFDFLRTAQITAAVLAGMVSLCALILTAPKAVAEAKSWFKPKAPDPIPPPTQD